MEKNPEVSIVRCNETEDIETIKQSLKEAFKFLGGLTTVLRKGDRVVIKPNLLLPVSYESGATTNPFVVEALIELLGEIGVTRTVIAEGAVVGQNTAKCFSVCGYDEVAKRKEVPLIDLKKDEFIPLGLSSGKVVRMLKLPKTIVEADAIISVPVLKTHDCFPVSLGLKNMKGVIHERDKQKFHLLDLAQCIVDLNKLVLPTITVIDGTVGMEGMGPVYGIPANARVLLASFDCVAADAVGSALMGIDPYETSYIKLASEQGLGTADLNRIKIHGESLQSAGRKFKRISLEGILDSEDFKKHRVSLMDKGGCSGCRSVITALIFDLYNNHQLSRIENSTIVLGQNIDPEEIERIEGRVICFGACTKWVKRDKDVLLPGCPPHILDVKKALGYTKDDFGNFSFLETHLKSFGWE
ncbi:MAG: DUF362 domain-containing protein [Spirochaetia bacterium]|jgi:uncharacterized protein (DUF362 family)